FTRASTSAMATRMDTWPSAPVRATVSWSRSRESSLSMEHHGRPRKSSSPASTAGRVIERISATTSAGKSGCRPRASMAAWAMAASRLAGAEGAAFMDSGNLHPLQALHALHALGLHARQQRDEVIRFHGLDEVVVEAGAASLFDVVVAAVSGDGDERGVPGRGVRPQAAGHFIAVQLGKTDVQQQDGRVLVECPRQ